jgi:hypothetical protein
MRIYNEHVPSPQGVFTPRCLQSMTATRLQHKKFQTVCENVVLQWCVTTQYCLQSLYSAVLLRAIKRNLLQTLLSVAPHRARQGF